MIGYKPQLHLLVMLTLFSGCSSSDEKEVLPWLEGHWERIEMKENRSAHERWAHDSGGDLLGWGVSLKNSDTVFVEKLKIIQKEGKWFYVADVVENPSPVFFEITSITQNGFVCENPTHDFPKKIQYTLVGDTLTAITSGDGKENKFVFLRKKPS